MLEVTKKMALPEGVSVVVCTYNAAGLIGPCLEHLASQELQSSFAWELLVVDNASSDDTIAQVRKLWAGPSPLRVVTEDKPGIAYARRKGMAAAKYAYIAFVDQDNWVDADWLQNAWELIHRYPDAGLIGAEGRAVFETKEPAWYQRYERNYAVGPQLPESGRIADPERLIYTAGCILRTEAAQTMLNARFEPLLTSRAGKELLSGEDSEIQLIFRYLGWELYYDSSLRFQHFMPSARLTWEYHKKFRQGLGATAVLLEPYRHALRAKLSNQKPKPRPWQIAWRKSLRSYLKDPFAILATPFKRFEGNYRVARSQAVWGELCKRWQLKGRLQTIEANLYDWLAELPDKLPEK